MAWFWALSAAISAFSAPASHFQAKSSRRSHSIWRAWSQTRTAAAIASTRPSTRKSVRSLNPFAIHERKQCHVCLSISPRGLPSSDEHPGVADVHEDGQDAKAQRQERRPHK